jgi:hypothetical protein
MQNKQIGESLAKKSPIAIIFTLLAFIPLAMNSSPIVGNLVSALILGAMTVVLLLGYWHGKGGSFFIVALLMPLVLVVIADLPNFIALAWLINCFFLGTASCLFIYLFLSKLKMSEK